MFGKQKVSNVRHRHNVFFTLYFYLCIVANCNPFSHYWYCPPDLVDIFIFAEGPGLTDPRNRTIARRVYSSRSQQQDSTSMFWTLADHVDLEQIRSRKMLPSAFLNFRLSVRARYHVEAKKQVRCRSQQRTKHHSSHVGGWKQKISHK